MPINAFLCEELWSLAKQFLLDVSSDRERKLTLTVITAPPAL
jgi:hypothetical protein